MNFTLVGFAMKYRTPVKLVEINKKLEMCISVGFDGFILALSRMNGDFLHATELHESDPSLLACSDFGCIVVGFNQGGVCLIKVLDQNLRAVGDGRIESPISCWCSVQWSDGDEYFIARSASGRQMLLKLPFIEELGLDFCGDFAFINVDFMNDPICVLLTDTKGRLFCTFHTFSGLGKWMSTYPLRKLTEMNTKNQAYLMSDVFYDSQYF
jgi:hypothetical protein